MVATPASTTPQKQGGNRFVWWIMWAFSIAILLFLIISLVIRITTPIQVFHLRVIQDIAVPDAIGQVANGQATSTIVPGLAERLDHFDFQALDPRTHLLFIAHSGPAPDKLSAILGKPVDAGTDGNILVVDTNAKPPTIIKVIGVPQVTGIEVAPDIGWVYASDANDSEIWPINEHTFQTAPPIHLNDALDSPDAMTYDALDHKMFISDPGAPANPTKDKNIALKNQNMAVIDVLNNKLVEEIPIGVHQPFGDSIGHVQYDRTSQRIYVDIVKQDNLNLGNPPTSPAFIDVIDPTVPMPKVVSQVQLPNTCLGAHGFVIDPGQEIGFIVCRESFNLLRVQLPTLKPLDVKLMRLPPTTCDIARLDQAMHLLFIGCTVGVAVYDESPGRWTSLGYQPLGGGSNHTIAVVDDANTHAIEIYVPIPNLGNRPILRIAQYIPDGTAQYTV